jgi:hypothetical protein
VVGDTSVPDAISGRRRGSRAPSWTWRDGPIAACGAAGSRRRRPMGRAGSRPLRCKGRLPARKEPDRSPPRAFDRTLSTPRPGKGPSPGWVIG